MATVFGTRVTFRRAGVDGVKTEQDFFGDDHCMDADAFCKKHVAGLTPDQYKTLSSDRKKKLELRRVTSPTNMTASVEMYCRIKPVWDWHQVEPLHIEQAA